MRGNPTLDTQLTTLREYLSEVTGLKTLRFGNQEFSLWVDKVKDTLELWFGTQSLEFQRFQGPSVFWLGGDESPQADYLREAGTYESELMSIIQRLELKRGHPIDQRSSQSIPSQRPKIFIAHGGESLALTKLEEFLIALGCEPVIAEKQPSEDRSVNTQVEWCLSRSDCAVVLATAESLQEGKLYSRPNVYIELGRFQERFPGKTVYLLEEGAKFPSNISEKVWEHFNQGNMERAFRKIVTELRAFGFLKAEVGLQA